ncbi:MAG: PD-(D/E)XK nuclease family protein, partial [Pseudomonadota bacterium]
TLSARADRIEARATGLTITDYKTGTPPKKADVLDGRAPQLPLEAAIALRGGFSGLDAHTIACLRYVQASGGEPAGTTHEFTEDLGALADNAWSKLEALVSLYDRVETPYQALRRPGTRYAYDAYEHLARVKAWTDAHETEAAADGEGGET